MGKLLCEGNTLPDLASPECVEVITRFDDCCHELLPDPYENQILLYETLSKENKPQKYYWFTLEADESFLIVCRLEDYAKGLQVSGEWQGRMADYLAMGWYEGECFVVIIELRHVITHEDDDRHNQIQDKFEQVEMTLNIVIEQILPQIEASELFSQACHEPDSFRLAGAILVPSGIKKRISLSLRQRTVQVKGRNITIVMLPHTPRTSCQITWSEILESVGAATGRRSLFQPF